MNILVLTNNPTRASFRQRIEIYLNSLQENRISNEVVKLPKSYPQRWKLFAKARKYDAVLLQKEFG